MMDFVLRLVQVHESFREPEVRALAELNGLQLDVIRYDETSPFCLIQLPSVAAAETLISRAILAKAIYELWGRGSTVDELHGSVKKLPRERLQPFLKKSFRFEFDSHQGSRPAEEQRDIIHSFSHLGLEGPIALRDPEEQFAVLERYHFGQQHPEEIFFGRKVAESQRHAINTYSLKKREYIATTSLDSELALVSANLLLAGPGKLVYDPFVGTGSLPIACSHFGAYSFGSDIDGRMVRGKQGRNIKSSFEQYKLRDRHIGDFIGDLTHSPLRNPEGGWLDGIICDPPYGVREGLKVLGTKDGRGKEVIWIDGVAAHMMDTYVPPKKPYSFDAMLADILQFAAFSLVEGGRISFWMPTVNENEEKTKIPQHESLELVSECIQPFNKWSRRLLTYKRLPGNAQVHSVDRKEHSGKNADDLNNFRKRYFEGFKS